MDNQDRLISDQFAAAVKPTDEMAVALAKEDGRTKATDADRACADWILLAYLVASKGRRPEPADVDWHTASRIFDARRLHPDFGPAEQAEYLKSVRLIPWNEMGS